MGRIDYETETMIAHEVAPTLNAQFGNTQGIEDQHINGGAGLFVAHALRGEGHDASEDGTGRSTPIVPVAYRTAGDGAVYEEGDVTAPLTTGTDPNAQVLTLAIRGRGDSHNLEYRQDGTANAVLTPNGGRGGIGVGAIAHGWAVRRLTPLECTRLQGFPEYKATLYVKQCCLDPQKNYVLAETQNPKSLKSAPDARAAELTPSVRLVELPSGTSPHGLDLRAALHVLINSGRGEVRISKAGKLLWSASIADGKSASALQVPTADFVRLAVAMTIIAAKTTRDGRADHSRHIKHSTHPESGLWLAEMSGYATSPHASDVAKSISEANDLSTCITSSGGPANPKLEQIAQTLFSCAAAAIASFIQPTTQKEFSSDLLIEIEQGYFDVPGKPFADGPVYKMLGNSMAVNVMSWIGQRIAAVDAIVKGDGGVMTFHSGTYLGQHHTPRRTVMSEIVDAVVVKSATTETLAEHLCERQRKLTFDRQHEADEAAKSGDKARQTIASTEAERHRYAWSQVQLIVDDDHYEAKKTASTITTLRERVNVLEGELRAAIGYMTNAAIDLDTGAPKKTALATINGGIYRARTALGEKQ